MNEIRTVKREDMGEGFNEMQLEVMLIADSRCGRKTQHLIEEKIDSLFNEVRELVNASTYHIA